MRGVDFSDLASSLRVSRVAGDSFLRQIVTSHPCQSPLMAQTNLQYHSETVAVHCLGVAYQSLARKTCEGCQFFGSRLISSESFRVTGDSFQRELVTSHPCQSPFMTQTNIQQHSETVAVHCLGVAYQSLARKTCEGR